MYRLMLLTCLAWIYPGEANAGGLTLESTNEPLAWQVTVNNSRVDNDVTKFLTTGFVVSTSVIGRYSDGIGWIANTSNGSNAIGYWTQFVFRQEFDLTGYDPATAILKFLWAADDSGEGFLDRGTWTPKYRLNDGPLVGGAWLTGNTYDFGLENQLTSGFVAGINYLDFYIQGNGTSDGFAFKPLSLKADPTGVGTESAPSPLPLLGVGMLYHFRTRLRRTNKA